MFCDSSQTGQDGQQGRKVAVWFQPAPFILRSRPPYSQPLGLSFIHADAKSDQKRAMARET